MRYCPECRKMVNTNERSVTLGPCGKIINLFCEQCGILIFSDVEKVGKSKTNRKLRKGHKNGKQQVV